MSPLSLRRYLLDLLPMTWWDLAAVYNPEIMGEIGALGPGTAMTVGMYYVERLPDAVPGYKLARRPMGGDQRIQIISVGLGDVDAPTGLEVPAGIDLDQRARVYAAKSLDELRSLPFVLG